MSKQLDRRVSIAQMIVMQKTPFFAPGVLKLPVVWSGSVPTWQTDGERIVANPQWTAGLPDKVVPTIQCHEVMHCLLGHEWRAPADADWGLWNQACDHEVNLTLKEFSAAVMAKNLADPFPFPEPADAYCADPRFDGMAAEKIYRILEQERQQEGGRKPPGQLGGGAGKGAKPGQPAPHSMPVFGQMARPDPAKAGTAEQKRVKADWESTAIQSAKLCQGRGTLPGSLSKLVEDLTSCKVPWQELLRSFLREQCSDDWDFMVPCLEMSDSEFILPSLHSERAGTVVIATDTSGSTAAWHAEFQAEKQNCLDTLRPAKLIDVYCDSAVQAVREYTPGDKISLDVPGGGGTDLTKVFDFIAKLAQTPKCLVVLTDLDTPFPPEPPNYPVLWITPNNTQAPFGYTIKISE